MTPVKTRNEIPPDEIRVLIGDAVYTYRLDLGKDERPLLQSDPSQIPFPGM